MENVCDNKYYLNIYTALPQFSFTNVTFPLTFQFLIIFGTGFVVLTMARIHNVVWVRTPYSGTYMVMNVLEEHLRSVYTGHQLTAAVGPRQIVCAGPFRLQGSITDKITISKFFIYLPCIVSICYKKCVYTFQEINSPAILHYTLFWAEMYHREYNEKQ